MSNLALSLILICNLIRKSLIERKSSNLNFLLPSQSDKNKGKKTLILDLDETLVHSSFIPVSIYDLILPIDLEGNKINAYVTKRPGINSFIKHLSNIFEIVVFTASLSKVVFILVCRPSIRYFRSRN